MRSDTWVEFAEVGHAAHPTLALDADQLRAQLGLPADQLRTLHREDLYLACGCALQVPSALAAFEPALKQSVSQLRLAAATKDEVLQLARERLLVGRAPKIADYAGRGPLHAWLRMVVTRIAGELGAFAHQADAGSLEDDFAAGNLEVELLKADARKQLHATLREVFAALPERERAFLRLHYLHGLTMDQLAATYGESRSSIHRRIEQARERVLTVTHTRLGALMPRRDVESLLGVMQSWFDVGLESLLATQK